jgi:hypothetical protein
MRVLISILFCLIPAVSAAFEQPVRLFENNLPVKGYDGLVGELRSHFDVPSPLPVRLQFDGTPGEIIVDAYLGEGTQAIVFSSGQYALRLPLNKMRAESSTDNYFNAWTTLSESRYPKEYRDQFLPHIDHYQKREYVLAGKVRPVMDYGRFIGKYDRCRANPDVPGTVITKDCNYCEMFTMNLQLLQLVHFLAEFDHVGDAHKYNVVYVQAPNGSLNWMLLDFAPEVVKFSSLHEPRRTRRLSIFDTFQYNYETVHKDGKSELLDLRNAMNRVAEHARNHPECSGEHDDFRVFDPLFQKLEILCQEWQNLEQNSSKLH